ncbi:MAG: DUF6164 family protein [Aquimonas sp.]|nr:DUF6164 family protein [Aquimonas sp.]
MPARLLGLREVPEDEVDDIVGLLEDAGISHYLTPPGLFGLSPPALWLREPAQLDAARALLAEYHAGRAERARAEFEAAHAAGEVPSLWASLRARPAHAIGLLVLVIGVLLTLSLPWLLMGA